MGTNGDVGEEIVMAWHQCALKIHGGESNKVGLVLYLREWLWRQHYGDDAFGNIIKHIADSYEARKDA